MKCYANITHGCRSSIFTEWALQRLLGVAAFTDVTLVLKDEQPLIAHSVILSATRPFFRNILSKNNHNDLLQWSSSGNSSPLMVKAPYCYFCCDCTAPSVFKTIESIQTVALYETYSCVSLWQILCIRLLHPQHLNGIWSGMTPYRVPLNILSEYQEPWSWKMSGSEWESLPVLVFWKKKRVPGMGETRCEKNPESKSSWTH